jgi:putative aldouronate transport system permease protein
VNRESRKESGVERKIKVKKADIALLLLFLAGSILVLYPVLNVLSVSLSGNVHVLRGDITFYPRDLSFSAYAAVLGNTKVLRAFAGSLYITAVGCVLGLLATLVAAYPIACCRFPGKKAYTVFVLLPMWFSGGMIPTYMCISRLGLVNSYWSLILGGLIIPFNLLVLVSFLKGLPESLIESARLDGAGEYTIMLKIAAPLAKPALATIALWIIAMHWNAYIQPLLYITDFNKFTLQQVLQDIVLSANATRYEMGNATGSSLAGAALPGQIRNAVLIVSMVPMMILYPFIQKYFVQGTTIGAVKE